MKFHALTFLLLLSNSYTHAQLPGRSPIIFDTGLRDTTHYTNNWKYNWYITKDSDGKFHNQLSRRVKKRDTVHQFFSAHLHNNINGGSYINFCDAAYIKGTLILDFHDLDVQNKLVVTATADSFTCTLKNNPATCGHLGWVKDSISRQQLTLNSLNFTKGNNISGYIHVEYQRHFHSNTTTPSSVDTYHISGYFSVTTQ